VAGNLDRFNVLLIPRLKTCYCYTNLLLFLGLASAKPLRRLETRLIECCNVGLSRQRPLQIGGTGTVVQIDESAFSKRKVSFE